MREWPEELRVRQFPVGKVGRSDNEIDPAFASPCSVILADVQARKAGLGTTGKKIEPTPRERPMETSIRVARPCGAMSREQVASACFHHTSVNSTIFRVWKFQRIVMRSRSEQPSGLGRPCSLLSYSGYSIDFAATTLISNNEIPNGQDPAVLGRCRLSST